MAGAGAGHQVLLVVPSLELVVVRNGGAMGPDDGFWGALERHLFEPVVAAVVDRARAAGGAPYPPSPALRRIDWAPKASITRRARGSDNWPLAWAEDDSLYTAYGDGRGFEPYAPRKLSVGLAKVTGSPEEGAGLPELRPRLRRRAGWLRLRLLPRLGQRLRAG